MFAFTLSGARGWATRDGRVVGEDYLAFHMAGEMVRTGRATELYDLAAQESWQRRFMAGRDPHWSGTCLFLNPPHYAWALSGITGSGYGPALVAWWALALGAFALTAWIWRAWLPGAAFGSAVLLACCLPAWFQALAGGQNSFISLLVLTAFCGLLLRGRDLLAGCVLALLAFKFQLLIVPVALLVYHRRWAALGGVLLGGGATVAITLATLGVRRSGITWVSPHSSAACCSSTVSTYTSSIPGMGSSRCSAPGGWRRQECGCSPRWRR